MSSKCEASFTVVRKPEKWLLDCLSKIGNGIVIGESLPKPHIQYYDRILSRALEEHMRLRYQ
jgi:hypothetical protein